MKVIPVVNDLLTARMSLVAYLLTSPKRTALNGEAQCQSLRMGCHCWQWGDGLSLLTVKGGVVLREHLDDYRYPVFVSLVLFRTPSYSEAIITAQMYVA